MGLFSKIMGREHSPCQACDDDYAKVAQETANQVDASYARMFNGSRWVEELNVASQMQADAKALGYTLPLDDALTLVRQGWRKTIG